MRKNPGKKSQNKLETDLRSEAVIHKALVLSCKANIMGSTGLVASPVNSGNQMGFNQRSNMPVPIAFKTLNPKDLEII